MSLSYGFCLDDLSSTCDSAQFSDAFRALVGDGITPYGARFALTINGFTAALASGYALAAGRWLKNDEPLSLTLQPSGNHVDRTDALVVRVDEGARRASLEVLSDIDPDAVRSDPALLREDGAYRIALYFLRVRRGSAALTPEDVTDLRAEEGLCGYVTPLSEASASVLYIYRFLTSGMDQEVARLIGRSGQILQKGDQAIASLEAAIEAAGAAAGIGEIMLSPLPPAAGWLLCDGSAVPAAYPDLSEMLNGMLPDIRPEDVRLSAYIYGGRTEGGAA